MTDQQNPSDESPPPRPSFIAGFEGIAVASFSPEACAILGEPVKESEVSIKYDGAVYLEGVWFRRQLTRAFGAGAWALAPRGPSRRIGETITYPGALYILGRFVSEAIGECETHDRMSPAGAFEGAKTDCLRRCCKDLGMAAECWDKAWCKDFVERWGQWEWNDKKKRVWSKATTPNPNGPKELPKDRNAGPRTVDDLIHAAKPSTAPTTPTNGSGATSTDLPVVSNSGSGESPRPSSMPSASATSSARASSSLVARIREAAKASGWTAKRSNLMFFNLFGISKETGGLDVITAEQAEDALRLFQAAKSGDAEFDALVLGLHQQGRVAVGRALPEA